MSSRIRLPGTALAATALALAGGCGPSPAPPVVAVAPAVAGDPEPDRPKAAPGLRNLNEALPGTNDTLVQVQDGGSFPFPDDSGGKVLAKTLTPAAPTPPPVAPAGPRTRSAPDLLTAPAPPLAIPAGPPLRLAVSPTKEFRPSPLPERVPPDLGSIVLQLPPRDELPTGPGARVSGPDPSIPPELPQLATKPVPDRAPLADPTTEFTARNVISVVLPLRLDPAVFVRINLPDPFEHAPAARPRTPVVEDPNRSLGSPPPPRK